VRYLATYLGLGTFSFENVGHFFYMASHGGGSFLPIQEGELRKNPGLELQCGDER
jgi:hypothetical protein